MKHARSIYFSHMFDRNCYGSDSLLAAKFGIMGYARHDVGEQHV